MANIDTSYGMDLFVCFKLDSNQYSYPINMGSTINSKFRESTPMLSKNTKRIYFTSDRPEGYGGSDIYYSDRLDFTYTQWSKPKMLNPPVNTTFDDSHPHIMHDDDVLYFTSNRDGTSDIFSAKLIRHALPKNQLIVIEIINGLTNQKMPGEVMWGNAYQKERPGYF